MVSDEALELADGDRLELDTQNAATLALALLRANTTAYGRQRRILRDDRGSPCDVAFLDLGNELRNLDGDGTGRHATRILAMEAAGSLLGGLLQVVTVANLFEIMCTYLGILLPDRYSWYPFCHITSHI